MNTRTLPLSIKSISDAGVIQGVISAFGGIDTHGDKIAPGAYARSLSEIESSGRKLPLLYQHDPSRPIGVWEELRETGDALVGRAELAMEVRDAREAHALAKKGALTGLSIGFNVAAGGTRRDGNVRVLTDIDLVEASLVTFPADLSARVTSVKAVTGPRDIAELLQDAGVSGRKAKAAAGVAWRAINEQSDEAAAHAELAALFQASTARLTKKD